MKEATGDMTMTIVVIVLIVAVLTFGTTVLWPFIQEKLNGEINEIDTTRPDVHGYVEVIDNYYI